MTVQVLQIPGFDIERTLGKGGIATVYLATQASLRRKVTLKTVAVLDESAQPSLATTHLGDTQSIERLIEEARMIASLSHPNIVTVFDIGATDELLYIGMEYLQGGDLSARIRAVMPVRTCLSVLLAIAHALEAHVQNVIHRDVKPANILFREDDTLVLSDFGLAKWVTQDIGLTQIGLVLGSPFYMSPEQIEAGQIDEASDTYNLGVVLFEMLSGHLPFAADNAYNLMMQHLKAPIPTLAPQLSALQTLLNGMLAKRAEERFSIAQVLSRLSQLQGAMTFPVEHQPVIVVSDTGLLSEVIEKIRQGVAEDLAADRVVLPTLPEVAMKVRDVVSSADVTAKEIAQIVATDPGLSARLLRVANSATYDGATPSRDLGQTVVRLGHKMVLHLLNLLVVAQLYDAQSHRHIRSHVRALWRHSTWVATLSERISKDVAGLEPQVAMLGGLIHDIGKLPILAWAQMIPDVFSDTKLLGAVMQQLHVEMGARIVTDWQYSQELIAVVAGHEDIYREHDAAPDYVDVAVAENLISHMDVAETNEFINDPVWNEVSAFTRLSLTPEKVLAQVIEVDATTDELSEALIS